MLALAITFGFTPSLVGRLVLFRVRRELRSAAMGTRRALGQRLDDALGALHLITHQVAAEVVAEVLRTIAPVVADTTIPEREALLDTVDYLRGRAAPFLGDPELKQLLGELGSAD